MSLTFSGCKQTVEDVKITRHDASNPKNPYDYVGKAHNELLKRTIALYRSGNKDVYSAVKASYQNYSTELNATKGPLDELPVLPGELTAELVMSFVEPIIYDVDNGFVNVINNADISTFTQNTIMGVIGDMVAIADLEDLDYEDAYDLIVQYEDYVISRQNTISEDDYEAILSALSTLRNSAEFWSEYSPSTKGAGWLKWLYVGCVDALDGLLGGSLLTPVIGPVGYYVTGAFASGIYAGVLEIN